MSSNTIEGVRIKQLKPIPDERGMLVELMRDDDPIFVRFGQVYVTTAFPGVVKGWHYHKEQIGSFSCVRGMIKLVLYDDRESSRTRGTVNEFFLGLRNPVCVQVPAQVWHGFKCVGEEEAIVVNVSSVHYYHDRPPDEYRRPWDDPSIPYNWERRNG